jgi:hypothetical protein
MELRNHLPWRADLYGEGEGHIQDDATCEPSRVDGGQVFIIHYLGSGSSLHY